MADRKYFFLVIRLALKQSKGNFYDHLAFCKSGPFSPPIAYYSIKSPKRGAFDALCRYLETRGRTLEGKRLKSFRISDDEHISSYLIYFKENPVTRKVRKMIEDLGPSAVVDRR